MAGVAASILAGSLVLAACSSSSPDDNASEGAATEGGASTGVVTANGSEPQNPLIPTNTNEVGGGKILDLIFAGLVYYDADGAVHNEVADSIETEDNQNYTIKIKEGWKFTDGTPVTSKSFVDAWNQGALLSNGHLSSYFFEPIEGYSDTEDSELTGLKVVDDQTFTVKLKQPEADFPLRLGYSAFFPLPQAAFDDPEGFGENPVGNGPYKLAGDGAWQHNVQIELVPNEDYAADRKAQNGGVTIKFYDTQDAAYNDLLSGNLDVLDAVPDSAFGTFEQELGDRAVNQPAAIFQSFTVHQELKHFAGEEGQLRRQAISHAINRQEITDTIFQGTRTPASDFTSPVIDGWSDSVPGSEVLEFDPEKAKELWAEADKLSPWDGKFTLAYNSDGGHQAWVDATMNSIKNTLGIEAEGQPYALFADLRTDVTDRKMTGGFRTGWQADYPALGNFLGPIYGTGAGSNDGDYSNPEVDDLLKQAAAAPSIEESNALYQKVQEILFKDLPAIPLWYSNVTGGYAETVDNVEFGWNSVPLYYEVTKAE
ncbi:peptide ABC transporter substrate-binding protein [Georgenia thermotolerans]|uniref:ABC transporter substrate-binding protein n=1 Tax=Georgenia thermotolerans TaxID=527326 RepID=A0A7J5UL51_9MICO|nr:ABC transporter substrate-binding protein [Georgenia thermotolerans]KAE8763107.1 ABC transporter substrate-binding protein [Georgenia thermotolerans]